jgi:hypothetical protein
LLSLFRKTRAEKEKEFKKAIQQPEENLSIEIAEYPVMGYGNKYCICVLETAIIMFFDKMIMVHGYLYRCKK